MDSYKSPLITCAVLSLMYFPVFSQNSFALRNYNNHPDLAKAMEFDSEMNGYDMKKADRSKAEFHYLRYLEDIQDPNESFQRARVYCQLGALYAVSFNREKGEERDLDKAREYYKKVLENEPNRIGRPTLVTRMALTSLDNLESHMERLKARVEFHKWLTSIDENKIKKLWLPLTANPVTTLEPKLIYNDKGEVVDRITKGRSLKDPNVPTTTEMIGIKNSIESKKEVNILSAVDDALAMEVPEEGLIYIMDHLPADAPEKKIVEEAIKRGADKIADEVLREELKSFIADQNQPQEVTVKRRFVPHIDHAAEHDIPFVFDFKSGNSVRATIKDKFDDQEIYNNMIKLGRGDFAWNGNFLTTRKARLFSVKQEAERPLKRSKGKYSDSYKLPDKTKVPYTLVASDKEGTYYLVRIIKIVPEGLEILYRELPTSKISFYLPNTDE